MSLLSLQTVTKIFGGLTAVNEVSFDVEQGSIVGLIGPNGAGKTTVFNLITGNYVPDGGDIRFAGQSIKGMKPHTIVGLGIARTFQSIRLFPTLPLVENVLAGRHCRMHSGIIGSMFHTPAQRREERAALERAMNELEFVGLADSYAEEAGSLSYGNQRLLEIARALASDPKLIILDEPTVGLDPKQIIEIRDLIKSLGKKHTVILSSHILSEVSAVCDYVMIIAKGQLVASDTPENLSKLMLGSNTVTCTVHGTRKQLVPALNALDAKEIQYENTPNEEQIKVKITTEKDKDIREELFYALAKANCPILELTSSSMSLEDVFLELTDDSGKAARKLKEAEKEQLKQKECEKECEPEADKTAVGETSEEKSTDAAESAAETKQEEGDAQ